MSDRDEAEEGTEPERVIEIQRRTEPEQVIDIQRRTEPEWVIDMQRRTEPERVLTMQPDTEPEERRVRKLTPKALELYIETKEYYEGLLHRCVQELQNKINESENIDKTDILNVSRWTQGVSALKRDFEKHSDEYLAYLLRIHTDDSLKVCDEHKSLVNFVNDITDQALETMQISSERGSLKIEKDDISSVSSTASNKSTASLKRAKAEAAFARLEVAKKEVQLKKKIALYEADLTLLAEEKKAAGASAEADYLEMAERSRGSLKSVSSYQRTRQYIETLPKTQTMPIFSTQSVPINRTQTMPIYSTQSVPINRTQVQNPVLSPLAPTFIPKVKSDAEAFTSFLLKKDMLLTRLYNFNDEAHLYCVWRASFNSVIQELNVNAFEQLDLLVKHLGKESRLFAQSIRSSNATNPDRAIRLIWNRLEERYGRPEMVESYLRTKLDNFPVLTYRDNKKLYELSDLVNEINSAKENPEFGSSFATFESSRGVNIIVNKLPYDVQKKWIACASKYKKLRNVLYPPFTVFVEFLENICTVRNDPAFDFKESQTHTPRNNIRKQDKVLVHKTGINEVQNEYRSSDCTQQSDRRKIVRMPSEHKPTRRTQSEPRPTYRTQNGYSSSDHTQRNSKKLMCVIHPESDHTLLECHVFKSKTFSEKRGLLRYNKICFKCLASRDHQSPNCPIYVKCNVCDLTNHVTLMHRDQISRDQTMNTNGGEPQGEPEVHVNVKSTEICDRDFEGKSCGKIVLVDITHEKNPNEKIRVYAILDDQSNRSLITPELCKKLELYGEGMEYTLTSCSGNTTMVGQRVNGITVHGVDTSSVQIILPELIECQNIPQDLSEVPTPDVASQYPHLKDIAHLLHPLNTNYGIHILIGRDVPEAHHMKGQKKPPKDKKRLPFAINLPLGWVIIGKICLGQFHEPNEVKVYKTNVCSDGRYTVMDLCENRRIISGYSDCTDIFHKSQQDNKIGLSAEDRQFIKIMDSDMIKDASGQWLAPLPFKDSRETLPNNINQAYNRAMILDKNLKRNTVKQQHMVEFMQKVFDNGAAEVAIDTDKEKWYLPLFGVYHQRKPGQIRGVFDSSAVYEGKSLNDMLLCGPNLTNSIVGVLLRFRSDEYAVSADIEQMFYRFLVNQDHRRFLRFFWYQDNNPSLPLMEYQMRVHVFGNRPSPAVATYGLRKTVENADEDIKQHVLRDFYVDDAFSSHPTREEAVSLLSRTQKVLKENGAIRLHKIASNDIQIMNKFPKEDLGKDLKSLDLDSENLPQQLSLGLLWDLNMDAFKFSAPNVKMTFSRRGLLSSIMSVYDPLGFLSPFTVSGKMLLREACQDNAGWDEDLPEQYLDQWKVWNENLLLLHGYQVPRMFAKTSLSLLENPMVYIFTDASEKGIAAVGYLVSETANNKEKELGFIMGKAKVAPKSGHSIPRLELCGSVLGIDLGHSIAEHLNIEPSSIRYFTDSKVVLGYIHNRTRRFYTYVSNRVAHIHDFSEPNQWNYIESENNPADAATRSSLQDIMTALTKWNSGIKMPNTKVNEEVFELHEPNNDNEIRPVAEVNVKVTLVKPSVESDIKVFESYSSWKRLVKSYAVLIHVVRAFKNQTNCGNNSWHVCEESTSSEMMKAARNVLIAKLQNSYYQEEIWALGQGRQIQKNSKIISLSPYLDETGLLRVGGRINNQRDRIGLESANPIIIPKCHIATLLVKYYHEQVVHQGRHFTESSLRSNGFWLVGAKRLVSSVIGQCVVCRKLRGQFMQQKMADLPKERLIPEPPFTTVGVDVFGPWEVVTRKTRGGAANSKRWAVMFTCMTTRATHIEVIEDMSSSCFINALSRLISIRGPVKTLCSDRGTNFVGAASLIKAHVINVEDQSFQTHLKNSDIVWKFNSPHSSHMGGVWERPIGTARRILESMFMNRSYKELTHEILCTFMYEVSAIMNSKPLTVVDSDSRDPVILSPSVILTQKQGHSPELGGGSGEINLKDMYSSQWKRVQTLSNEFWKRWRQHYIPSLQTRRKWEAIQPNLKVGDLVLLRDVTVSRSNWPLGIVERVFPGVDDLVRKAEVRIVNSKGDSAMYTRPVTELVLLLSK